MSSLSRHSGAPQSEISKIESGAINASEVTLLRLLGPMGWTLGLVRATLAAPKKSRGVVVVKGRTLVSARSVKE